LMIPLHVITLTTSASMKVVSPGLLGGAAVEPPPKQVGGHGGYHDHRGRVGAAAPKEAPSSA